MNKLIEYITGMNALSDQVIATQLLIVAKSGVRNYSMAVTEAITPEIKETLTKQLEEAIDFHEKLMTFMLDRGWYHPWNLEEQIKFDMQNIQTTLNAPTLQ